MYMARLDMRLIDIPSSVYDSYTFDNYRTRYLTKLEIKQVECTTFKQIRKILQFKAFNIFLTVFLFREF